MPPFRGRRFGEQGCGHGRRDVGYGLHGRSTNQNDFLMIGGKGLSSTRSPPLHTRQRLPRRLLPPTRPCIRADVSVAGAYHGGAECRRRHGVGPTIGAHYRLVMALPTRRGDRPRAAGAHVAQRHRRPRMRFQEPPQKQRLEERHRETSADGSFARRPPPLTGWRGTSGPVAPPAMLDEAWLLNFVIASGNA
jgi:hypothetical protein